MAKNTPAAEGVAVQKVEVTLSKPHTHNGRKYPEGEKITVTPDQEVWLKKQGVVGAPVAAQQEEGGNA